MIWLDFQDLGSVSFQNEATFSKAFLELFLQEMQRHHAEKTPDMAVIMKEMYHEIEDCVQGMNLMVLARFLQRVCKCSEKPVILMIDEVDSASK